MSRWLRMPLYEDKLINPLAVRFTQEHIRPVFQDGTDLEETVRQIRTKPGTGGYDILLKVPFESIEVIRWHKRDTSGEEAEARRWFTFDNRRLYCMQRAAAALWPLRVGVEVQALYAATDGSHRKDNSSTAGRIVHIGHSMKMLTDTWSWRDVVASRGTDAEVAAAFEHVSLDEQRSSVKELEDAPAQPSMMDLFLQGVDVDKSPSSPVLTLALSDESTDIPSPRSTSTSDDAWTALSIGLCGTWEGNKGDMYTVKSNIDGWACVKKDKSGRSKTIQLWYDAKADCVWWGSAWDIYMQASEVRNQIGTVKWYSSNGSWDPKVTWTYADVDAAVGKVPRQPRTRKTARGAGGRAVAAA